MKSPEQKPCKKRGSGSAISSFVIMWLLPVVKKRESDPVGCWLCVKGNIFMVISLVDRKWWKSCFYLDVFMCSNLINRTIFPAEAVGWYYTLETLFPLKKKSHAVTWKVTYDTLLLIWPAQKWRWAWINAPGANTGKVCVPCQAVHLIEGNRAFATNRWQLPYLSRKNHALNNTRMAPLDQILCLLSDPLHIFCALEILWVWDVSSCF